MVLGNTDIEGRPDQHVRFLLSSEGNNLRTEGVSSDQTVRSMLLCGADGYQNCL